MKLSTLARVIESMIKSGRTDGIAEKIDIFFASGKLTTEEYQYLISLLNESTMN